MKYGERSQYTERLKEPYTLSVTGTSTAGGIVAAVTPETVTGYLHSIEYQKDDYSNGAVLLIDGTTSGQIAWTETGVNASETLYPRRLGHTTAGADLSTLAVNEPLLFVDETLTIALTGAGNVTAGTFIFTIIPV